MSWMPPELATPPEDRKYECTECNNFFYSDMFTHSDDDKICNDCYIDEEVSRCCGAEIILGDICMNCREHI